VDGQCRLPRWDAKPALSAATSFLDVSRIVRGRRQRSQPAHAGDRPRQAASMSLRAGDPPGLFPRGDAREAWRMNPGSAEAHASRRYTIKAAIDSSRNGRNAPDVGVPHRQRVREVILAARRHRSKPFDRSAESRLVDNRFAHRGANAQLWRVRVSPHHSRPGPGHPDCRAGAGGASSLDG